MQALRTGWRSYAPLKLDANYPPHTTDKKDLFEAARLCCQALALPASCRFILDQLCAAYGGELVQNRVMVWPSNDYLSERTGICERTIRSAIRYMIQHGIIGSNDSPNGKRYAKKNQSGHIVEVFGFDLSPILHRLSEFRDRLVELQEVRRQRSALFDRITIARRSVQEGLRKLAADFAHTDSSELEERFQTLSQALPRRSSSSMPIEAADLWETLLRDVHSTIESASGGNICRHIDTNTKAPEIPCNKRGEEETASDLVVMSCPDAAEILGAAANDAEMCESAERYRGMLGISHDAWLQARQEMGLMGATMLLYHVVQLQARPARGVEQIRNLGGYFRSMVRMIGSGKIDLEHEIRRRVSK